MSSRYTWNDIKRAKNLAKHQLDFSDAGLVLFRPASRDEREIYHEWLKNDFDGS